MSDDGAIHVGDRVVQLQVPGIFTVVARRGRFLEIENERGVRLNVLEPSLRRVDGTPPTPKD